MIYKSLSIIERVKSEIIVSVLDYIENNNNDDRKKALAKLHEFAKFYSVPLRNQATASDIKNHLRKFILNKEGYNQTILKLFNSLKN